MAISVRHLGEVDYDEVERLAKEHKPKMIIGNRLRPKLSDFV